MLLFDDNGGHPGMQAAELIARAGSRLEVVSPERFFAPEIGGLNHVAYAQIFQKYGVTITINRRLVAVRREAGLPVSWLNAFDVLRNPAVLSVAMLGGVLFVILAAWLGSARAIYALTIGGEAPLAVGDFIETIQASPHAWELLVFGNAVGFLFALLVLTIAAVSFPLLLDRNVSPMVAVQTSVRAVILNPVTMLAWGFIVAAVLLLGCLPLFVGLAVAMPVLGHATWHLYRRVVEPDGSGGRI